MISTLTADTDYALQDSGQSVTKGSTTVYGFVRTPDELTLETAGIGGQINKMILVTMRNGALSGLAVGDTLTTGGVAYKVLHRRATDGGHLVECLCRES